MKGDYNMQWTIDGKEYDTDTAKCVGSYKNTPYHNDANFYEEMLYRKKTGEFFLYGQGNTASKYAEVRADRMRSPGEIIIPLTEDEAKNWVEQYGDVDTYIELFGEVEE